MLFIQSGNLKRTFLFSPEVKRDAFKPSAVFPLYRSLNRIKEQKQRGEHERGGQEERSEVISPVWLAVSCSVRDSLSPPLPSLSSICCSRSSSRRTKLTGVKPQQSQHTSARTFKIKPDRQGGNELQECWWKFYKPVCDFVLVYVLEIINETFIQPG